MKEIMLKTALLSYLQSELVRIRRVSEKSMLEDIKSPDFLSGYKAGQIDCLSRIIRDFHIRKF